MKGPGDQSGPDPSKRRRIIGEGAVFCEWGQTTAAVYLAFKSKETKLLLGKGLTGTTVQRNMCQMETHRGEGTLGW